MRAPEASSANIWGRARAAACSSYRRSLALTPWAASSLPPTRVSSQSTMSAAARTSSARRVMSRRLPIGVATRYKPEARSVTCVTQH